MRLLLVDPAQILLDGLGCLFEQESGFEVVGTAKDGREAVDLARALRPDVVLIEVSLPELNGIDATRRIREACPGARVLALTDRGDGASIHEMLAAGASGYVLKESGEQEVALAIRTVASGKPYLAAPAAEVVLQRGASGGRDDPVFHVLTVREREVVQLVAEGYSSKKIAQRLKIGTTTVDTHRHNAMRKLGIDTTAELVKAALRAGLTRLEP